MTALITTNNYKYYPNNYTANFAIWSNLLTKLKPNKVIQNPEVIGDLNLLRNRAITPSKVITSNVTKQQIKNPFQRLGDTLLAKKQKTATTPYSLRSQSLNNPNTRKLITTTNQSLKNDKSLASTDKLLNRKGTGFNLSTNKKGQLYKTYDRKLATQIAKDRKDVKWEAKRFVASLPTPNQTVRNTVNNVKLNRQKDRLENILLNNNRASTKAQELELKRQSRNNRRKLVTA